MKSSSDFCRNSPSCYSSAQLSVDVSHSPNAPVSVHSAPPRVEATTAVSQSGLSPSSAAAVVSVVDGLAERVVSAERLTSDTADDANRLSQLACLQSILADPVRGAGQAIAGSSYVTEPAVPITISTDEDEPQAARSIFDDHPPLTAAESLSPPSNDPPAPPTSPIEEQPPLPPRKDKNNLKIRVPREGDTNARHQGIMSLPPSPMSPRSRGPRNPISPRTKNPPSRRVLSPQSRQLRKEREEQSRKISAPVEMIPLPSRRSDAPADSSDSDEDSSDCMLVGTHVNLRRVKNESIGSLDDLPDKPVFFGNDFPDETPSCSSTRPDEHESRRHASFLYKKRPSEGDNSLFFSSSFVSPVSLDDSCFDLRNFQGTASMMSSPVQNKSFTYRSDLCGSATSLPKSESGLPATSRATLATDSALRKKSSDSSNVMDSLSINDSPSSSDREHFELNKETMRKASQVPLFYEPSDQRKVTVAREGEEGTDEEKDVITETSSSVMRGKLKKESQTPDRFTSQPSTSGSLPLDDVVVLKAGKRVGDLRIIEVLRVRLLNLKGLKGSASKPIFIVAKLDNKEIHRSCGFQKNADALNDEFNVEVTRFSQLHLVVLEGYKDPAKSARPIGMVSVKRKDLTKYTGGEISLPLSVVSRCRDVQGQICVDIKRLDDRFWIKVIDYSDLDIKESAELYLLVTPDSKETRRLRIGSSRGSEDWLEMRCIPNSPVHIKMTLWHDMLRGLNAMFHGQVRVDLPPENCTNTPSKWFYLRSAESDRKGSDEKKDKKDKGSSSPSSSFGASSLGEMRIWLSYTADHVLPMAVYEPLLNAIQDAVIDRTAFSVSLVALIEQIPQTDLSLVARPLVNIFAFSQSIRPLLCKLFEYEITKCQDMNTLFRSQSLAIKMMNELMRVYGHYYLVKTIKPALDTIYNDRLCCEVDPSKLQADEILETNQTNLVSYFTACFDRVVSSAGTCPFPLREIFSDLRAVVRTLTGKHEVEMLALSSFLVMRFFAPAILNPKSFGVKRDQPGQDSRVGRTLVLLSKMLQRLANCVVSTQPLISKESWLVPVMSRVTSEENKRAMCAYLESISSVDGQRAGGIEGIRPEDDAVTIESYAVVKEGTLVHHPVMTDKGTLRRIIGGSGKKKRYVVLTESEVGWQKARGEAALRECISLSELKTIDRTNVSAFRIRSDRVEMVFEAATQDESTEWINSIRRQRERALVRGRPHETTLHSLDVDIERELEAVHTVLVDKANTLAVWKNCLEQGTTTVPHGTQPLPKEIPQDAPTRASFIATLARVLEVTYGIEEAHQAAIKRYTREMSAVRGTRENPIGGDEHYLIVKAKRGTLS